MYSPETGYRGSGWLTVWADDQGNTGTGGALSDYGVTPLVVGGPVVAAADTAEATEDTPLTIDVRANDAWAGSTPG